MPRKSSKHTNRLEDAARAGWLYYVAKNTQDEIAGKMKISRQSAQRLVALALQEGLIKFRLDHPVAKCMDLAAKLKAYYELDYCEVTLADPSSDDPAQGIAQVAAVEIEKYLLRKDRIVIALGTGKEIRGAVNELSPMKCPQHRVVSLVGNLAPDGSANFNAPLTQLSEKTLATRHPLAVPVIAGSVEERDIICGLEPIERNIKLAQSADVCFVGIGELNDAPPLLTDGFINWEELKALQEGGAVGEIIGFAYDQQGRLLGDLTNDRVTSVPLSQPPAMPTIGVARGANKLAALRGALAGKWINGLITDETTARTLLDHLD